MQSQGEDKLVTVEEMANYIQRLLNFLLSEELNSLEETQLRLRNCFSLNDLERLAPDRGIIYCWFFFFHVLLFEQVRFLLVFGLKSE
jgi:hypothetical protein